MSETIKRSGVNGRFTVSTIRTSAEEGTPWPYETMVFKKGDRIGLYHEPFSSRQEALAGHERISDAVLRGGLPMGEGVSGGYGTPSMTPGEWADLCEQSRNTRQGHALPAWELRQGKQDAAQGPARESEFLPEERGA